MPEGRVYRWYRGAVKAAIANPLVVIALCVGFAGSSYLAYQTVPQELTPTEDRSVMFIPLTAPQGSSLKYTDQQVAELEDKLAELRQKLMGSLTDQFDREMRRGTQRIEDTVAPFARFVRAEQDKIGAQRDQLVELEAHIVGLRAQLRAGEQVTR
jgi:multidrug efflux pump subunit AcrB